MQLTYLPLFPVILSQTSTTIGLRCKYNQSGLASFSRIICQTPTSISWPKEPTVRPCPCKEKPNMHLVLRSSNDNMEWYQAKILSWQTAMNTSLEICRIIWILSKKERWPITRLRAKGRKETIPILLFNHWISSKQYLLRFFNSNEKAKCSILAYLSDHPNCQGTGATCKGMQISLKLLTLQQEKCLCN